MSSSKTLRKVEVVSPVPADIDIANSVEPFHISEIAQELNLTPNHYDLYGKYKAKVIPFFFTRVASILLFDLNIFNFAWSIRFYRCDLFVLQCFEQLVECLRMNYLGCGYSGFVICA